jgi:ParB family chromosome partitioning protein
MGALDMARKGILTTDNSADTPRPATPRPATPAPRGAVGALQSSLSKLQENAIQEVDAALIDDAGVEDRLGTDSEAQRQLVDSLKTYGQQVPVLLRPHATKPQRFEIVYGRRRLAALRTLGLPVKAMIRQLDDQALVMAQGQENTARQDLSFIEKASFAAQLNALSYERQTIADALSIDLPMVSRMLKVGGSFDIAFLKKIGSAPGIGRDRWIALAKMFETDGVYSRVIAYTRTPDFGPGTSDDRFEKAYTRALQTLSPKKTEAKPNDKPRSLRTADGRAVADIRSNTRGVTLNIPARTADGFDIWVNDNAETLLADLHTRWTQSRNEDQ